MRIKSVGMRCPRHPTAVLSFLYIGLQEDGIWVIRCLCRECGLPVMADLGKAMHSMKEEKFGN